MFSPEQQLLTLLWMLVTGVGVGLIFDLYRIGRGLVQPRWFLTALGDLLFWLLVVGFTYGILLWVNFGQVRSFVFLGIFCGLFFYYRLLSGLIIRLALIVIVGISRGFAFLVGVLNMVFLQPGRRLIHLVLRPLRGLGRYVHGFLAVGKNRVLGRAGGLVRGLRRRIRLIYRLLKHKLLFLLGKK
ncbi:MAG: spore cortex biosynthesis protein YabQ [Firmicutes bacterium]|nr:spore cortex biosynthesis protein YabQ [Bacillota bacterium]